MPNSTSTADGRRGASNVNPQPYERDKTSIKERDAERRAIMMVRGFMEKSSEYREPHLELARQSRRLYETWQPTSRSIIQRANLKLPFGFTIIETQLPQLMDIFFKGGAPIEFQGQGADDAQWEDPITDFHNHQLDEMAFESKAAQFMKAMLLDGTAFAKVPYRFKEVQTMRRESQVDPLSGEVVSQKRPVLEVLFDGPDVEPIPIYDFFPDWSVKNPGDVSSMRGVVHRTFKTFNSLKQAGIYKNLNQIKGSLGVRGSNAWAPPQFHDPHFKEDFERLEDNRRQDRFSAGHANDSVKNKGKIEVWEYWGLYDPRGDGKFEEFIITIANGDVLIREEKNFYDYKFKPFVACPNYLRSSEFYGIPELLAVRSLIKEANTLRNARLDNVNLSVNPMWIADRASGVNAKSLYSRPNGIVWTNDINGIKPLPIQDPSVGSLREMQDLQQDIQTASAQVSAAPVASQLGKQFGRSATGVQFIQSFSGARIGLKARILSEAFFKQVAWIMLMTNRQFVTEEKWVRVSDPNSPNPFVQLPADAFFRKYDFRAASTLETGGPEGQLSRMQAVSQIVQAFEATQPGSVKSDILLEALLRPIIGRKTKKFVRDDEERQQLQQQQLAAEQAANAAAGAAAPQPNAGGANNIQATQDVLATLGLGE